MSHPTSRALPRPTDPIRTAVDALRVLTMAMHRPLVHETLAFLLDSSCRSRTITVVSGTERPDDIAQVVEVMARAGGAIDDVCGLVVASVRPSSALVEGDAERWTRLDVLSDDLGVQLVEWFVVGPRGADLPREQAGMPARW
jgi:hypothetical protein